MAWALAETLQTITNDKGDSHSSTVCRVTRSTHALSGMDQFSDLAVDVLEVDARGGCTFRNGSASTATFALQDPEMRPGEVEAGVEAGGVADQQPQ
ncbi:hypothetical protein ON010_g14998 [Phytophthora cinnamomi]|nr:hypothetical protein ON010_g14998 [Phytophthora cinnamomi]